MTSVVSSTIVKDTDTIVSILTFNITISSWCVILHIHHKHRPASRNMLWRAHRTLQGHLKKEKEELFFTL